MVKNCSNKYALINFVLNENVIGGTTSLILVILGWTRGFAIKVAAVEKFWR